MDAVSPASSFGFLLKPDTVTDPVPRSFKFRRSFSGLRKPMLCEILSIVFWTCLDVVLLTFSIGRTRGEGCSLGILNGAPDHGNFCCAGSSSVLVSSGLEVGSWLGCCTPVERGRLIRLMICGVELVAFCTCTNAVA